MHDKDRKRVIEWLESFLLATAIAGILFFICWPLQIDGDSMENTLHNNDRVLMSRIWTMLTPPLKGDIVVCEINEPEAKNIIKRVIALPGEHIVIRRGDVYIDGTKLNEEYLKDDFGSKGDVDLILEKDEYFVMGDYREVSNDSRNIGPIKSDKIVGKIFARFFPFDKIQGL